MSMANGTTHTNDVGPNRQTDELSTLFNRASPIHFAPRDTHHSTINDNMVMLDPRPVQQWQLDAAEARLNSTEARLTAVERRIEDLAVNNQILREDAESKGHQIEKLKATISKHSKIINLIAHDIGGHSAGTGHWFLLVGGFAVLGFWHYLRGNLDGLLSLFHLA